MSQFFDITLNFPLAIIQIKLPTEKQFRFIRLYKVDSGRIHLTVVKRRLFFRFVSLYGISKIKVTLGMGDVQNDKVKYFLLAANVST